MITPAQRAEGPYHGWAPVSLTAPHTGSQAVHPRACEGNGQRGRMGNTRVWPRRRPYTGLATSINFEPPAGSSPARFGA